MTDFPFGFGLPGGDDPNWADKAPLFAELQKLMSWSGGPVNWDLAIQTAISTIGNADPVVGSAHQREIAEAIRLADLWLDPHTSFSSGVTTTDAWSRVAWIEKTRPSWATLCDPVAARVVEAMGQAIPDEAKAQAGPMLGMLGQFGGMMFGAQVGQALASLGSEVLTSTDIGLPLGPVGTAALLPANVEEFGRGLELPESEVRLYLALREAAHHRLFSHVGWLRSHLFDAVEAYSRGITIDTDALTQAAGEINPNDPEALQQALSGGLFEPENTPEQQVALRRLETSLALVEGWVDGVVDTAATGQLPGAAALAETLRRRRASGGPAEETFATLVGLQLRPRKLREASRLWTELARTRGTDARDALWGHPDLLPAAADLDEPEEFVRRSGDEPFDIDELDEK